MRKKCRSVLLLIILLISILNLGCKEEKVFDADEISNREFAKSILGDYYQDLAEKEIAPLNDSVNDLIGVWVMTNASWDGWQDSLEYYVVYNNHCIWVTSFKIESVDSQDDNDKTYTVFDIGEIVNASDIEVEYKVLYSVKSEKGEIILDNCTLDGKNIVFTWTDEETSIVNSSTFSRVKESDFPELDRSDWNDNKK